MMWRSRRKTKKIRTREKPWRMLWVGYSVIGVIGIVLSGALLWQFFKPYSIITPLSGLIKGATTAEVSKTARVERLLSDRDIPFLFVTTATDAAYVVTMSENAEVLLGEDDLDRQIASLQLILSRLTMEGKRFSRLDLRFTRPVIVLK